MKGLPLKSRLSKSLLTSVLALNLQAAYFAGAAPAPVAPPVALPQLAALEVTPAVLGPGGSITLTLPPNYPLSNTRLRVGLFEHGRPALVTDALRDFALRDGRLQNSITVQADPGAYDFRLISNDRARVPFSAPAPLIVPGIEREAGWWLLNGSPLNGSPLNTISPNVAPLSDATRSTAIAPPAPLFIAGLARDFGKKPKPAARNIAIASATPLEWKTLALPSLRNMLDAANFDFATLRASLEKQLREAQAAGARNYVGFELATGSTITPLPANAGDAIKSLRQILNTVAPGAALILRVDARDHAAQAIRDIDACAPLCDAVVIALPPFFDDRAAWPLKAARRVAEEQPNYDLPIFVRTEWEGSGINAPERQYSYSLATLDYWMSGATGILDSNVPAAWGSLVRRNLPLFVGSVTLEDAGVLPVPDDAGPQSDAALQLYNALREAGRVPLLARTTLGESSRFSESFAVTLGERLSDATVQQFKTAATGGARIYIEGAPVLDEKGESSWKLGALLGATATATPPKRATVTLEDPWIFGFGRGAQLAVEQSVTVTMNPETATVKIKPQKGKDILTGPRVVARLEDGSPAVVIIPVGQGEIIWMPHRLQRAAAPDAARPQTGSTPAAPLQRYYAAIAAYLQPALVRLRAADPQQTEISAARVSVRRSPKGALLVAVLNPSARPVALAVTARSVAAVALDLAAETELPLKQRGFESEASVTIPAQGWKIIAFATTRKALDDERLARRLNARIK